MRRGWLIGRGVLAFEEDEFSGGVMEESRGVSCVEAGKFSVERTERKCRIERLCREGRCSVSTGLREKNTDELEGVEKSR